jgi:hypothetical protein
MANCIALYEGLQVMQLWFAYRPARFKFLNRSAGSEKHFDFYSSLRKFQLGAGAMRPSICKLSDCFVAHFCLLAALMFSSLGVSTRSVVASEFAPVNKLTTWGTDRSLIDIEIPMLASKGRDDVTARDEPPLRLRIERAFVSAIISTGPESKIVTIGFDRETLLPQSVLLAKGGSKRFNKEPLPDVPEVPFAEQLTRTLLISINARESSRIELGASGRLAACVGKSIGPNLYESVVGPDCRVRPPAGGGNSYIANLDGHWVVLRCKRPEFHGIGCVTRFSYEGFFPKLSFHRKHLASWREIVGEARAFLDSKKFR